MPSVEFWFGDPQDYFVYQDAFADEVKRQHDEADIIAWTNASYELMALRQALSEFFGKRGSNKRYFPEEPNSLTKRKESVKTKIDGVHPLLNKFMTMASAVNNKFKEE